MNELHLPTMYTALAIGATLIIIYICIKRYNEYQERKDEHNLRDSSRYRSSNTVDLLSVL